MTDSAAPKRRKRRLRLADVPVGAKLAVILVVPLIAIVALTAVAAVTYAAQVGHAGDLRATVDASVATADLVDTLQRERLAAARLLADGGDPSRAGFQEAAARTDQSVHAYKEIRAQVHGDDPAAAGLADLAAVRTQIMAAKPGAASPLLLDYRAIITTLVSWRESVGQLPGPSDIAARIRALGWLTEAKEDLALSAVAVLPAVDGQPLTRAAQQAFVVARGGYADALRHFTTDAPAGWRERLSAALAGDQVTAAETAANEITLAATEVPFPLAGGADRWQSLTTAGLDALRGVESSTDSETVDAVRQSLDAQDRTIVAGIALVILLVAVSVAVATVVARSTARSLRVLQTSAWRVAHERLPQVVAAMQDPDTAVNGPTALAAAGDPVPVTGRDEVGQAAEAFNAVHREAVRAAAEQAALRTGISTMFVNLARRSLRLVDRLIEQLDDAERDEADPDRLALLFGFDHLATRLRHANDSLLVLAGSDAGRVRRRPVALLDLLRAAQSQIEDYTRIEFGRVDDDVSIAPHAVDAIVHLLAELFDNATHFSAPDRPVFVSAHRDADTVIVRIADRGDSLAADTMAALNQRLADPPVLGVADSRAMGIAVVARLARRHGIDVTLQPAVSDGVIAVVTLPSALVRRTTPATARPADVDVLPMVPRPLERAQALPGGEPLDIPSPRSPVPVDDVGPPDDNPTAEWDPSVLPKRMPRPPVFDPPAPRGAKDDLEPDEVRALLSSYQHAMGRFGAAPLPPGTGQPAPDEGAGP